MGLCPSLQSHSAHSTHLIFKAEYILAPSSRLAVRTSEGRSLEVLNPCSEGRRVPSKFFGTNPAQSNLLEI